MTNLPALDVLGLDAVGLTGALRRAGFAGTVRAATVVDDRPTVMSHVRRLQLDLEGAGPETPTALFLKTGRSGSAGDAFGSGRHEVAFYDTVAPQSAPRTLPRCFGARWASAADWYILLEDLSATHRPATQWPLPPKQPDCTVILSAWARFHASWWDAPRLGNGVGEWPEVAALQARQESFAKAFAGFADRAGDRLPPARRALYARVIAGIPRLRQRLLSRRCLTLVHGDAHVWNCLLPNDGSDDVRLFDWDAWHIGPASDDLAYMMAMHWYPDRRAMLERSLLDRYHATLLAAGVTGYSRDDLDADYRLSVLTLLRRPVWQAVNGIPPVIWWNNLERLMMAVDDLGCRELLD